VTPFPTGQQHRLTHGTHHAVVVEQGAGLREYVCDGTPLVDGYAAERPSDGSRGELLLPWPNRIADARYRFENFVLQLPVTEPRTGCAIHGLTHNKLWRLVERSESAVALALNLEPEDGYPFPLELHAAYSLGDSGLSVTVAATNRGNGPCPYGAGAHPYVRLASGGPIDDAVLHLPAAATLEADERGIPTGAVLPVTGTRFDFLSPRPIGGAVLDTAFTGLGADDDNVIRISLRSPDGREGVMVWMDESHPYVMIYSGDTLGDLARRRHGLAIEPMTCAPDAFNSGAGLVVLEPGAVHSSTWGIAPLAPG
jgi:galactose mutarotase-like enzyme